MAYITTGLLILSLTSLSLKAADTNSVSTTPNRVQPKFGVVCWLGVAAAAGLVVYAVYKCCQAAGLTSSPPPPTPPGTNSTIAQFTFSPMDYTVPTPGSTNGVGGTNTSTSNLVPGSSVVYFNTILVTNNDASMEAKQDISTNGWTDWQGNPYTWFFVTQTDTNGPHIQTSTNLVTWTDEKYLVYMWLSSSVSPDPNLQYLTNMVTVLHDGNGVPLVTNWSSITPGVPVNTGFPATAPQMYFRGVTP